ncbi:hypothetical protein P3S67_023064 [Capsicum chacoense]
MSRILHKIEEKLHIHHHKLGNDPAAAQNKPEETHEVNDESNVDKKEDIDDHDKKKNLVKKVAGKIAKKLLHGHHKKSGEEGYEGEEEEEEEGEEGEEIEEEEGEGGGFEFELNFDF